MIKKKKFGGDQREYPIRVNERIRWSPVRVVDNNGENLGVIVTREALALARERGLDLVEVAPNSRPPVCRIMDYGKYKYEQSLKEKKQKHKSAKQKEIKLSPVIDDHDLETKLGIAKKFLGSGQQVQFRLTFHRRQLAHKELGFDVLKKVVKDLDEVGSASQMPRLEGRSIVCVVDPKGK